MSASSRNVASGTDALTVDPLTPRSEASSVMKPSGSSLTRDFAFASAAAKSSKSSSAVSASRSAVAPKCAQTSSAWPRLYTTTFSPRTSPRGQSQNCCTHCGLEAAETIPMLFTVHCTRPVSRSIRSAQPAYPDRGRRAEEGGTCARADSSSPTATATCAEQRSKRISVYAEVILFNSA